MANTLTRSAQGLNLAEKRILFSAIVKMGNNFGEVYLYASEYAKTFELPEKQAYEQLKKNVRNMRTRYFTLAPQDRTEATAVKKKARSAWCGKLIGFPRLATMTVKG